MKILYIAPYKNFAPRDGGYGNASNNLLETLQALQEKKLIEEIDAFSFDELSSSKIMGKHYDVALLVINPNSLLNSKVYTDAMQIMKRADRCYLNILWETLPLPSTWDSLLKKSEFTGFFASSHFLVAQLLKTTRKPVYYIPYHIDTEKYPQIDIKTKLNEMIFTVLFIGQNTVRKGIEEAIVSYCRTFNSTKDSQLVIKGYTLSNIEAPIEDKVKKLALTNMNCKNAPVYLIDQSLTNDEMYNLYCSSSCLLFPSRGEGFGLPPAEAMSCGLPVIYTDWSSLPEVCESPYNIAIPYILDEAVGMFEYGYEYLSYYAFPNKRFTMKALYAMYKAWKDNKEEYYINAAKNREVIGERFTKKKAQLCMEHFLLDKGNVAPEEILNRKLLDKTLEEYDTYILQGKTNE